MSNPHAFLARQNAEKRGQFTTENAEKMVISGMERRFLPQNTAKIELRSAKRDKSVGMCVGYAATYNTFSEDMGGWFETILPGAFKFVMDDETVALFNHDDNHVLGRRAAGTLRLFDESDGLRYEIDLPDTSSGRDLRENLDLKNIPGSSFQFRVAMGGASWDFDAKEALRSVSEFDRLIDVGPVTFPAFKSTSVDVRSFTAAREQHQAMAQAAQAEASRKYVFFAKARLWLAQAQP